MGKPKFPTASLGHLDNIESFPSGYVAPRALRIWRPSSYDPARKYDVVYMHDGQNLFDGSFTWNGQEWAVDRVLDPLITQGRVRPAIVVGIDNTKLRMAEYCPDDVALFLPEGVPVFDGVPPLGNSYLRFMVEEVKPYVDSHYSTYTTREHTFTIGSSGGALISLYALCKYPEVFGGAGCLSTHCTMAFPRIYEKVPLKEKALRDFVTGHLPPAKEGFLYMDNGGRTLDETYKDAQEELNQAIRSLGWDEQHFTFMHYPEHSHCEKDWSARLDVVLEFLLGKR